MTIVSHIEVDLKQAMLSRDELKISTLRGLKSSLQYAQVALGKDAQLSEQQVISVLQKEVKKRVEAANLYLKADNKEKSEKELSEKTIIESYLPPAMSEEEIRKIVDEVVGSDSGEKNMGRIIGEVKQKTGGSADGALIAKLVQKKLKG